jgi:hypothetical protein
VTARKREPRAITVAELEREFQLASYWWGEKFCPAVHEKSHGNGYGIRVVRSVTVSGQNRSYTYDYFELDADGTITTAPRGHAKDYKPGRVGDIAEAAERYATPDPKARRVL